MLEMEHKDSRQESFKVQDPLHTRQTEQDNAYKMKHEKGAL